MYGIYCVRRYKIFFKEFPTNHIYIDIKILDLQIIKSKPNFIMNVPQVPENGREKVSGEVSFRARMLHNPWMFHGNFSGICEMVKKIKENAKSQMFYLHHMFW